MVAGARRRRDRRPGGRGRLRLRRSRRSWRDLFEECPLLGKALTATELTEVADVTKQTVSAHLSRLVEAKLVAVESQGRHRYFRLADDDVAHLLESLMGVAFRAGALRLKSSPREPALRKARVCYDHLAGDFGVMAFDTFQKRRWLRHDP